MALYLQDSYLISQLTLSICYTFYIVVLLIKLSEASTPVSLETRSLASEFSMSFCIIERGTPSHFTSFRRSEGIFTAAPKLPQSPGHRHTST